MKEKDPCYKPGQVEKKINKSKKKSVKITKMKEGKKTISKHESKFGIALVKEENLDEDFKAVQEKLKTYLEDINDIEEPRITWCKLHGHNPDIYQLANLKNPKMVCPICQKEFPVGKMNGKLYFNHLRLHKFEILKCSCETKGNYNDHIKLVHWGWVKCTQSHCETIMEQRSLQFHIHLKHLNHGKKISCPTCIKTFTVRQFKSHMDSHIEAPPFCTLCGLKYKGRNHRKHHDQVHHLKELQGCDEKKCYFTCSTQEEMNKHTEIRHTPVKQKQFICDKCGHICTRQDYLKAHKLRMHDKTVVQCPKCPKMFNEESLKDHMRKFHAALSVCTICGAKVKKLKDHMHLHIPYEQCRFKCQECLKGFMVKTSYTSHMMNVHLKERPYKCRYGCELGYNDTSNRNQHEKRRHGQLYTK